MAEKRKGPGRRADSRIYCGTIEYALQASGFYQRPIPQFSLKERMIVEGQPIQNLLNNKVVTALYVLASQALLSPTLSIPLQSPDAIAAVGITQQVSA